MTNSRKRLVLAIGLGATLQVVLLAFGLHASLWFDSVAGGCMGCYWALVGAYFTSGLAIGLVAVPWARRTPRVIVAAAVLFGGALFGLLRYWGAPT